MFSAFQEIFIADTIFRIGNRLLNNVWSVANNNNNIDQAILQIMYLMNVFSNFLVINEYVLCIMYEYECVLCMNKY